MSRKLMIAVAFVFTLVVSQSTSFAEKWSKCGELSCHKFSMEKKLFKKIHMLLNHKDQLSVTDEQLEQIKEIKTTLKKIIIKKDAEIELIKVDIRSALHEDEMDLNAVNELIDQKYEVKKAKSKQVVASLSKLKKTVSKEQMQQMKNLFHKKLREGSHGRHQNIPEGSHHK